jgi:hypothetical protein
VRLDLDRFRLATPMRASRETVTCREYLYFTPLDTPKRVVLAFLLGGSQFMPGNHVRNRQAGSSNIKALLWTGFLVAFVYVCVRVVPLYVADFQFRDSMETAARFASVNHISPDDIRQNLYKEAERAEMPVKLQDIKVANHNGRIDIEANYSVTVDLHVYQWTLNFHPSASNSRL